MQTARQVPAAAQLTGWRTEAGGCWARGLGSGGPGAGVGGPEPKARPGLSAAWRPGRRGRLCPRLGFPCPAPVRMEVGGVSRGEGLGSRRRGEEVGVEGRQPGQEELSRGLRGRVVGRSPGGQEGWAGLSRGRGGRSPVLRPRCQDSVTLAQAWGRSSGEADGQRLGSRPPRPQGCESRGASP